MIYIYGCGGHAKVLLDIIRTRKPAWGFSFVDDFREEDFLGCKVMRPSELPLRGRVCVAVGDNRIRAHIVEKLKGHSFPRISAPSAVIAEKAPVASRTYGQGVQILNQTYIGPATRVGDFAIINNGATVDHDCTLGDFVHIAPGVHLCGNVKVGRGTLIGVGAVVIPGVEIGEDCTIGAGSVVVEDIPSGSKAYGNPCRVVPPRYE